MERTAVLRSAPAREEADSVIFDTVQKRRTFIQNVYGIMSLMLIMTGLQVCTVLMVKPIADFILINNWLVYIAMIVYFVALMTVTCGTSIRKRFPHNLLLLLLIMESLTIVAAFITLFYDTQIIAFAFASTALMCAAITVIAIICPFDLTGCRLFLMILASTLLLFSIVMTIIVFVYPSHIMDVIYSFVVLLFVGIFLAYDTQMIFGGRRYEMDTDDYLLGAITLYIDIVMIFIYMLRIMGLLSK